MKTNLITRLTTIALLTAGLLLCGCGGDNPIPAEMPAAMDTATGTVGDTSAPDNMITGNIVKGPVQGAVVIIYSFDGTTELGRGETDANGSFTISIGDNAGGIIVSASGGTYTDEATGAENVQFGATQMRAAYMIPESMTAPFTISINVTPFTEIAVRDALVNGVVDAQLLAGANNNFFELGDNVIDILRTLPTNTLIDSANEQTPEDLYGLFLAAVSQIINSEGLAGWEEAVSLLQTSTMTDNLLSAAITTLGSIDSNAGANISVSAASSALSSLGISVATDNTTGSSGNDSGAEMGGGSDTNSDSGDGSSGTDSSGGADSGDSGTDGMGSADDGTNMADTSMDGSDAAAGTAMPCISGTAEGADIPGGLAGTMGDLTLSFSTAASTIPQNTITNFTFAADGSLTVDSNIVATSAYSCGGTEILWYDATNDLVYALSFTSAGSFNEINLNTGDGTFLGQYTDVNGDFANVSNSAGTGTGTGTGVNVDASDSMGAGNFNLSITGTVSLEVPMVGFGVSTSIPEVNLTNIAAPDPNQDLSSFEALLLESGFEVTGMVEVTIINNTADRVTFNLKFEGTSSGVRALYDLTYDYQRIQ